MQTFWKTGQTALIGGLDILGLRQHDQSIEQKWVSGITTVSYRARYLSLLPWVIGAYLDDRLEQGDGEGRYTDADFNEVLSRLAFLVIAASRLKSDPTVGNATFGVIGSSNYAAELADLMEGKVVQAPSLNGRLLYNTYVGPSQAFGLVTIGTSATALPFQLTQRGKDLYDLRSQYTPRTHPLTEIILRGGELSRELLDEHATAFSVNHLTSFPDELARLHQFLTTPYASIAPVVDRYVHFNETLRWGFSAIETSPAAAEEIIEQNYMRVVERTDDAPTQVEREWTDYEIHRRVHYALELLLGAVTCTLQQSPGALSVGDIVDEWKENKTPWESLPESHRASVDPWDLTFAEFEQKIDLTADVVPAYWRRAQERGVYGAHDALNALALITGCFHHWRSLTQHGITLSKPHIMDMVFELIGASSSRPVSTVARDILEVGVVQPHLTTALRKMAGGQQCSLRFYPEGLLLHPTGITTVAGWSATRLANILGMMADLGYCRREPESRYAVTEEGRIWATEVKA